MYGGRPQLDECGSSAADKTRHTRFSATFVANAVGGGILKSLVISVLGLKSFNLWVKLLDFLSKMMLTVSVNLNGRPVKNDFYFLQLKTTTKRCVSFVAPFLHTSSSLVTWIKSFFNHFFALCIC